MVREGSSERGRRRCRTWRPSRRCGPGSARPWWSTCAGAAEDFLAVATPGRRQDHLRPADRRRAARRRHDRGGHRGRPDRAPEDPVGAGRGPGRHPARPAFRNADVHSSADFHGAVVTYAQVGMAPAVHRRRTMTRRTLVILDEIHHAGDSRTWGDGVKAAFEPAVRRLMLTGTPFRSDDNPIPFVTYERGGDGLQRSRSDSVYGYADALRDGVVRPVHLPGVLGGDPLAHQRRRRAGRPARRADDPGPGRAGLADRAGPDRRLDAAGAAGRRRPAAGAARAAACPTPAAWSSPATSRPPGRTPSCSSEITGEKAVVVLSDDEGASARIADVRRCRDQRWMVAVRMVSEGVDIPRLAVGVYATSASTPLYFAQAIGRFVRARRPGETATRLPAQRAAPARAGQRDGGRARPRARRAEGPGRPRRRAAGAGAADREGQRRAGEALRGAVGHRRAGPGDLRRRLVRHRRR